jgi:hypothetical protein
LLIAANITNESPNGSAFPGTGGQLGDGVRLVVLASCQLLKLVGQEICASVGVSWAMRSVGAVWAGALDAAAIRKQAISLRLCGGIIGLKRYSVLA